MNAKVIAYLIYLAVSTGLTIWVGRTLYNNGRAFLVDAFHDNEGLADSVNHLLLVGFYLVNFGYVTLALTTKQAVTTGAELVEVLSTKVGLVLVVLGILHFANLYVFNAVRRHTRLGMAPPPVGPNTWLGDPNPFAPPSAG